MTADHLKGIEQFEAGLWKIADNLRANSNLASNEYFMPIMGLLFLRQATSAAAWREISAPSRVVATTSSAGARVGGRVASRTLGLVQSSGAARTATRVEYVVVRACVGRAKAGCPSTRVS